MSRIGLHFKKLGASQYWKEPDLRETRLLICSFFCLQAIVESLLNSWRRVSDRPSWILISKTPARKSKIVVRIFFVAQAFKAELKAEPDFRYTNIFKLRRNPIFGTQTF